MLACKKGSAAFMRPRKGRHGPFPGLRDNPQAADYQGILSSAPRKGGAKGSRALRPAAAKAVAKPALPSHLAGDLVREIRDAAPFHVLCRVPAAGRLRRRAARRHHLGHPRSDEHTSELQSLMRISYAV